ncbi:Cyclic nucleotide-gated potassium channel [Kordia antarctica]|uniref:Cyclic nucleotide-gated potassium channel n=1 Tax=Kordia antarctica TaxID=1218801 RepID=A0A7L4ZD66_9FLAO|nr:ion transporter [Kordia antarctica]QHI34802.1 Cyclic nucleotide-gated potassium channel [Kordia antarctica]
MKKDWKAKLHEVIYEADTPAGKLFDIVLMILIFASILLVMLESVNEFAESHGKLLNIAEWIITVLFTLEYFARIISIRKPKEYIFSFYGIIDFLSTIPKYLSVFIVGSQSLVALRALRLLRVFRVLKLARYIGASNNLMKALKASKTKIGVFIMFILILCTILGSVMYLVESGEESGFTSIPRSIYWAIVTLTTVGYGDIAPHTALGQLIASIVMILGYGIIAVPTGIVTAEFATMDKTKIDLNTQSCQHCAAEGHKANADYCFHCGESLHPEETD